MATPEVRYKITARDRSKRAIRSAIRGFKNLARSVLSVRGAVVGLAGGAGLALLIRQSLRATDEIAKLSQRLGISTRALSELKFVGKLAGIEFNQFSIAIQRMIRRVAEVATGTGEAGVAMRDLGLDASELLKLSPDKQFEAIAESLAGLENNAERVRLAFKFFDSEGVKVIQTMARGGKGIAEFREEARRLGVSMSADMAANVVKANDEIVRFTSLLGGLRDQTVAALSPAIALATTKFRELIMGLTDEAGGVEAFSQQLAVMFLNVVETVVVAISQATNAIKEFFSDVDERAIRFQEERRAELAARTTRDFPLFGLAERGNIGAINTLKEINIQIAEIDNALVEMRDAGIDIEAVRAVFADLRGELEKASGAAKDAGDSLSGEGAGGGGLVGVKTLNSIETLTKSVEGLRAQTKALADEGKRGLDFARAWQQAAEIVRLLGENAGKSVAEVAALILEQQLLNEAIAEGSAALKKAEKDAKETTTEMTVFAEQASKNMQDVFAEFLFDPFDQGLKGMLKGFIDVLRRMIAEAIAAKIFEKIFGSFLGAGGGGGEATTAAPGAATGLNMTVPGTGPADSKLFAARVSPGENISITPRGQQAGGGISITENITINESQDAATTRVALAEHRQLVLEDIQRIMRLNGLRLRTP